MMKKGTKIIIGSLVGLTLITGYYFVVFKNRVPKLRFTKYNWSKRSVNAKFGNTDVVLSEFNNQVINSGRNYSSNYELVVKPLGRGRVEASIFKIKPKREITKSYIVDLDGKLVKKI